MYSGTTLVYGMHTDYEENKAWILGNFKVTGYYDADQERIPAPQDGGITTEDLMNRIMEFDQILVCADPVSIVADLIHLYHVPSSKIKVLFYEMAKNPLEAVPFYGEHIEDAALLFLFEKLGVSIDKMTYLEIGTNDPVRYNNSYHLYRLGARGYLVDPLPSVGDLVQMVRPEDHFINAAISDRSGDEVTFYACHSSTVSSLNKEHHKQWDGLSHNTISEITVPLIGINELFSLLPYVPTILFVDAEGYDEKIIHAINFHRYHPKVIMIEVEHFFENRGGGIDRMMEENNYYLFTRIAGNNIYCSTAWKVQ